MVSFLSQATFDKIRPRPIIQNTVPHCVGINGLPLAVDGIVQASFAFNGDGGVYWGKFLISDNLFSSLECILGWDFYPQMGWHFIESALVLITWWVAKGRPSLLP